MTTCLSCFSLDPLLVLVSGTCEVCRGVEVPAVEGEERAGIRAKGLAATALDVRAYHILGRPERDWGLDDASEVRVWRELHSTPATEPTGTRFVAGEHVGTVGVRVEVPVRVVKVIELEPGDYGRRFLCKMVTLDPEPGRELAWFTGENLGLKEKEEHLIRGTVSDHGEYNGRKQTTVQRVKSLKRLDAVPEPDAGEGGIEWDSED